MTVEILPALSATCGHGADGAGLLSFDSMNATSKMFLWSGFSSCMTAMFLLMSHDMSQNNSANEKMHKFKS